VLVVVTGTNEGLRLMPSKKRRPRLSRPGIGHNQPPEPIEKPLLIPRREACRLLNISVSMALRLEGLGKLDPVKLGGPLGRTHYTRVQVLSLAQGEG
jgi:hypothetical protein